jgi:hypothetical protein
LGIRFNQGTATISGPDDQETKYGVPYKELAQKFRDQSCRRYREMEGEGNGRHMVWKEDLAYEVEDLEAKPVPIPTGKK